jgi:hypothetical protein
MAVMSEQMNRKILNDEEPTRCDQCNKSLQENDNNGEWFYNNKNWSGVMMVYCRGCEDRRAEKFDDVENCTDCGDIVVEDDIIWYNPQAKQLDTDKGNPYCAACLPAEEEIVTK